MDVGSIVTDNSIYMMRFFIKKAKKTMLKWLIKKTKPIILRSEELQQVTELLFPPLETVERDEGLVIQVDYSVDSNLQSALYDLEEGNNDKVVQNTIRKAIDQLIEVRKILRAYPELDERAKYVIVDTPDQNKKEVEAE